MRRAERGSGSGGPVTIEMWHGQTDTGRAAIEGLVAEFHRTHPDIRVDTGGGVLSDAMLQKVTAALASGSYPDIAYIFGSDLASIARSPKVVDLTDTVHTGPTPWNRFWAPARAAVTVNGRVRAAPALLDSLAVVCNKKLFAAKGVDLPQPGWTWQDFVDTARALTDPGGTVFGTGWPGTGDEDTVWRLWPMIWDLGGEVVSADGKGIGFKESGVKALETVAALARDHSVYIDPKPGSEQMYQVFLSGRMGMVPTGPWQLPDIVQAKVDHHVVPLPSYSGRPLTISGPDTWTAFDNGSARVAATRTFLTWLMQPAQDVQWDIQAEQPPTEPRDPGAARVDPADPRDRRPHGLHPGAGDRAGPPQPRRLPADLRSARPGDHRSAARPPHPRAGTARLRPPGRRRPAHPALRRTHVATSHPAHPARAAPPPLPVVRRGRRRAQDRRPAPRAAPPAGARRPPPPGRSSRPRSRSSSACPYCRSSGPCCCPSKPTTWSPPAAGSDSTTTAPCPRTRTSARRSATP